MTQIVCFSGLKYPGPTVDGFFFAINLQSHPILEASDRPHRPTESHCNRSGLVAVMAATRCERQPGLKQT